MISQSRVAMHSCLKTSMFILRGVSKRFGEWYQKTNKIEDTNKFTLLVFKIIAILHNTLLATFIKLLETVSKGVFRNRSQNCCHTATSAKRAPFMMLFRRGNRKKSAGVFKNVSYKRYCRPYCIF
jgi:hypothetical protein